MFNQFHSSQDMRSIIGFLPFEKRIAFCIAALKVVLFLWIPRYSYRSRSIPIDPQVFLQTPKYSYGCPGGYSRPQSCGGIPIDPQVFLWYSYRSPSIPMAAQVGIPALKVAEVFLQIPKYSYGLSRMGSRGWALADGGLPRWAFSPSKLRRCSYRSPSIPMAAQVGFPALNYVWGRRRYNLL